MLKWKPQFRNKVEDSNIEEPVKVLRDSDDKELSGLAQQLLKYWSTLEMSYRIPRKSKITSVSQLMLPLGHTDV